MTGLARVHQNNKLNALDVRTRDQDMNGTTQNVARLLIVMVFGALLAGCITSQAYQEAAGACMVEAQRRFPANLQATTRSERYSVEVPTGETNCTSTPARVDERGNILTAGTSRCVAQTRLESRYRTVESVVDVNFSQRLAYQSNCSQNLCLQTIGTSNCRVSIKRFGTYQQKNNPEDALAILNFYFGEEWVSEPYGTYLGLTGQICGDRGVEAMPFESINQLSVIYYQGKPQISMRSVDWLLAWGPCGMKVHGFEGRFSQLDVDQIAQALKTLGARW